MHSTRLGRHLYNLCSLVDPQLTLRLKKKMCLRVRVNDSKNYASDRRKETLACVQYQDVRSK